MDIHILRAVRVRSGARDGTCGCGRKQSARVVHAIEEADMDACTSHAFGSIEPGRRTCVRTLMVRACTTDETDVVYNTPPHHLQTTCRDSYYNGLSLDSSKT